MLNSKRNMLIKIMILVGLITFVVFLQASSYQFVNYDDPQYVYENPAIRALDWELIIESFTASYMGWWMPLTWISFAIDYYFWGLNPVGYHLENIVIHAINAALVALIADQLLREKCKEPYYPFVLLLSALIWSIHPLRVESVAWVTERKDVLNGLFSLLTFYYYLRFIALDITASLWKRRKAYLPCFLFFLLSLMTKPLSVVIPVMFLVLDWYPLRRFEIVGLRNLLLEKLPFIIVSTLLVTVTLTFASGETILVSLADHPLQNRLLVAGYAMGEYLRLSLWPSGFVHFYPIRPEIPLSYYINSILFLAVTLYALLNIKKYPIILSSLALFILPLLPVLGFFQNGDQSHANRFTYLSSVFPGIAFSALVMLCLERSNLYSRQVRGFVLVLVSLWLAISALLTFKLIPVWRNSETLWSRQIAVLPVGRAYFYRGDYLLRNGEYGRAAEDFAVAVKIAAEAGNPEIFNLHALRGDALFKGGQFAEAVAAFTAAISIRPYANYFYHRSLALESMGRHAEAKADLLVAGNDKSPIKWVKGAD